MSRREFQFSEGTSNKFWAITLEGASHTVHFGRIGTAGQVQTKEFASEEEARRSYDKLIREKLRKGYVEVTAGPQPAGVGELKAETVRQKAETPESQKREKESGKQKSETAPSPPEPAADSSFTVHPSSFTPPSRSLDLDPADWFWATWRELEPLQRPKPAPFDQQAAVEKIVRALGRAQWSCGFNWREGLIPPSMSPEEAHFWFSALLLISPKLRSYITGDKWKATIEEVGQKLSSGSFSGRLSPAELSKVAASLRSLPYLIMLPLAHLLHPLDLIALITSPRKKQEWGAEDLSNSFAVFVRPFLSQAETEELRAHLRPRLDPSGWPSDLYEVPTPFLVAASLSMHDELLRVVESWPDDLYHAGEDWSDYYHQPQIVLFGLRDPRLVEAHLRRLRLKLRNPLQIRAWLAHTEYGALDVVRDSILMVTNKEEAAEMAETFALVKAPEAAPPMLELQLSSKAPQVARRWLEENAGHAIVGLVPVAAERGRLAEAAGEFLRRMKRRGYGEFIAACLQEQPPEIASRVRAEVLEREEKEYLPLDEATTPAELTQVLAQASALKQVKAPAWISPVDLPPVVLGERRLREEQVALLLKALQASSLEKPHPLVAAIRQLGDRSALDTFAWRLFELWLAEGAPTKERWAMLAVGLLGGDPSALKLAPMIRAWPGESQHPRAVLGLECLRAIGTDTALMQINGIAQRSPFKGLKQKAQECMEAIAQDLQLTRAQLEDRIVPDCDLDERGERVFDFGPRQFRFALGPELKPMVRDEEHKLRGDLPKPGARDDAERAARAVEEWKLLKKQVKEVAKIQAERLEQAMVTGRRWTPEEFDRLLVRHPLMTHLVRLLVWGGYDAAGNLVATFRVTEDRTCADPEDEVFDPAGLAQVGVVHPLHLPSELRSAWGELLSDYEIVPPFPQLGREVYRLQPGEEGMTEITRFKDLKIPAVSLVGTLERLGWARGIPEDAGIFYEHSKPFYGAGVTAVVQYDGVPVGYMVDWEDQSLERCFFVPGIYTPRMYPDYEQAIPLGKVDEVAISEVLRDLTVVASKAK